MLPIPLFQVICFRVTQLSFVGLQLKVKLSTMPKLTDTVDS
jgi:hypothetical protein